MTSILIEIRINQTGSYLVRKMNVLTRYRFILIFVAFMLLTAAGGFHARAYTNVTAGTAAYWHAYHLDILFLDVREGYEYSGGHIEGAVNMPWSSGYLQAHHNELPDKPILVYCAAGGRSAAASQFLDDNGHSDICNMLGGYSGWQSLPFFPPSIIPCPSGDYGGDGTADVAVFRHSSGLWSVRAFTRLYYGATGDVPVSGDYNGDGTTDPAVFRSGSALWAVQGISRLYFGSSSDLAAGRDYDGDGSCDPAVFRESSGLWAIRDITRIYFGSSGDRPLPGDYDGDGTRETAVVRPASGLWAVWGMTRLYFGSSGDFFLPADFDGDFSEDIGIFHGSSGLWAVRGITRIYYGSSGDIPVMR